MRLSNSLSSRQRRQMHLQLSEAQAAVEKAEDDRNKLMADLWSKGMPQAALMGGTGLGYNTIQNILKELGLDLDTQ